MKICLFDHHSTSYPIQNYAGIERVNQSIFTRLVDLGIDVTLVINNNNNYNYKDGNIIQLPHEDIINIKDGFIDFLSNTDFDIFQTHTSGRHQNFNFSNFTGHWCSICHGDNEDAAADNQVFVSESQCNDHVEKFDSRKRSETCFICHNGIDTSLLYPVNNKKTQIVWLGSIRHDKGVHLLPEVAEKIGEPIYIYGTIQQDDQKYFDEYIKPHLNKTVFYEGPIKTEEEKRDMFSKAKIYIHPALFNEPCGLTLLESQACGVPVVGFNRGCLPEIVYNKEGLGETVNDLADIIMNKRYAASAEKISKWINKKFTINKMVDNYIKIWKYILEKS